ncbi:glyoxylate/hydroxypyruvate reductase A [Rhodohalobacter sp. SW132]|nr:glyoxylate/hydroxypyruvate reductase A [Rhodohalobacter sp. SW132]
MISVTQWPAVFNRSTAKYFKHSLCFDVSSSKLLIDFLVTENMSILLISKTRNMEPFRDALLNHDNNLDVEIWPDIKSKDRVNFAVAWNQPKEQFSSYPNLQVVSSLGAGADHLLKDPSIPKEVKLTRLVAPKLSEQMCDYVVMSALNMIRQFASYTRQQIRADWKPHSQYQKENLMVGIMGLGELGTNVAKRLTANGFKVSGWAKSKKSIPSVITYPEDQLDPFLADTNILVCLLPLTAETEGILNLDLFKKLANPGFLINVARGEHLVEEDLIYALDMNLIKRSTLDVFETEPLPESHPFWSREKISITPHIASVTHPDEIAGLILDNYKRMLSKQELINQVDRQRGY